MSRVIFKNDIIYSTGEYLPAPYINRIFASEDGIIVENLIFLDDYSDVNFIDIEGNIADSKEEYKSKASEIKYYILFMEGFSKETYDSIIKNETNPILFYHQYLEQKDAGFDELDNTAISLHLFDAISDSQKDFFDESGNRITAYSTQNSSIDLPPPERGGTFEKINYVFCFSSTFDYFSNSEKLDAIDFNRNLFNLQIGDVSYEKVYEDGELVLQEVTKFTDTDSKIYEKVPLQSIDATYYKLGSISHSEIKESIESLLEEYSEQYNSETGNDKLKNVMNAIYKSLELYSEDADIVPRLEQIRRSFPDKTPVRTIGKFYKRFSKRLFSINKSIKQETPVFKKAIYNSKLVDLRSIDAPEQESSSYDDSASSTDYIYTNWKASRIEVNSGVFVVFGHFFFDYEKALRTRTDISRILNVRKLLNLGLEIPYEYFKIESVTLERGDGSGNTVLSMATQYEDTTQSARAVAQGASAVDIGTGYPYPKSIAFDSDKTNQEHTQVNLESADSFYLTAIANTIYGSLGATNSGGYVTSLINRAYTGIYDTQLSIENYRLMCYELLDYQKQEETSNYVITFNLADQTSELISALSNMANTAYEQIQDYNTATQEECVFNSDLGKFNEFFAEGIINEYSSSPQSAPWFTAPITYLLQLDMFYNVYDGDIDAIEREAKNISARINPIDGTKDAIEKFYVDFGNLIDNIYGTNGIIESSEAPEPTTTEISMSVSLTIPQSEKLAFGLEIEGTTESERTSSRFSEDVTVAVDATSYQEYDASNLTYYGYIYKASIPFNTLTHTPTEIIQATVEGGASVAANLDTENEILTLRYNTGIREQPGFYMPDETLKFTVGYHYDL